MTGYTRVFNETTGNTVEATDFNNEFQSIDDAFNQTSGHTHDGTSSEGAYVPVISDASNTNVVGVDTANNEIEFYIEVAAAKTLQVIIKDGVIEPDVDNDMDLGSASKEFKDLYLDGTANIDSLVADTVDINAGTIDGTAIGLTTPSTGAFTTITASGTTTLNGNIVLGSDAADNITFNGDVVGHFTPQSDDSYDIGSASQQWKDLYIDGIAYIDLLEAPVSNDATFTGSIGEETYTLSGVDFDAANGTIQSKVMSSSPTFTSSLIDGQSITLHLEGGLTYTPIWPTITWITGVAPTLTAKDVLVFWYIGAVLYGLYVGTYT